MKKNQLIKTLLTSICLSVMLVACSIAPEIDSIEDGLAVGYLTVESTANAAKTAYDQGWISGEQRVNVGNDLQKAKNTLDQGVVLLSMDLFDQAEDKLILAESILIAVQKLLQEAEP